MSIKYRLARVPFFWQVLLAFMFVGLFPLLLIMNWQQAQLERVLIQEKSQQLWLIAKEKQHAIEQLAQVHKSFVQQLTQVPVVKSFLQQYALGKEGVSTLIRQHTSALSHSFLELHQQDAWFLINDQGEVVFSTQSVVEAGTLLTDDEWRDTPLGQLIPLVLKQRSSVIQGYQWHELSANVAALVASPVWDEHHQLIGMVVVQMNKDWLSAFAVDRQGLGETGEINIGYTDSDGVGRPLTPPRYALSADQLQALHQQQTPLALALKGEQTMGEFWDYRGQRVISVTFFEPELNIGMVVKQDLAELRAPLVARNLLFLKLEIALSVAMVLVAWWFSRRLSLPLARISSQVKILGAGMGYNPLPETLGTSRELNALVVGMNQASFQLEDQIDLLETQAAQLEEQAADLEYTNQNLEQLVAEKTAELNEYVAIVDEQVITSRTDLEGNIIDVSEAFCRISGYTKEELIGQNHRIVRHPDMPARLYEDLWETISAGKVWHGEILNCTKNGSGYWVDATISPTFDIYHHPTGYVAVRQDITQRKRAESLSIVDDMTGLYNRRYFNDQVEKLWRMAARHQQLLAFIMIDVDFFKRYNDLCGHLAGDEALKAIASVLRQSAKRSTEIAFRLGGEEMAIISLVALPNEAIDMAQQIQKSIVDLAIPHPGNDALHLLSISAGVCFFDGRHCKHAVFTDIDGLYQRADQALYRAKAQGRNQVVICDQFLTTSLCS